MYAKRIEHRNSEYSHRWSDYRVSLEPWSVVTAKMTLDDAPYRYTVEAKLEEANELPPRGVVITCHGPIPAMHVSKPADIFIHSEWNKKTHWQISGYYNTGPLNEDCRPWLPDPANHNISRHVGATSINVAKSKSPQQIAKDILRRFMPEHKNVSIHVIKKVEELSKAHCLNIALAKRVAQAVGNIHKHPIIESNDTHRMGFSLQGANPLLIKDSEYENEVQVNYTSIKLELCGLTVEGVEAILELLKKGGAVEQD